MSANRGRSQRNPIWLSDVCNLYDGQPQKATRRFPIFPIWSCEQYVHFVAIEVRCTDIASSGLGGTRLLWLLHRWKAASVRPARSYNQGMDRLGPLLSSRTGSLVQSYGLQASSDRVGR